MTIIDDAFLAEKYDEFNRLCFKGRLPKHKVLLKRAEVENGKVPEGMLHPRMLGEFHPERGEIWINANIYGDREYEEIKEFFDAMLKHEMVHAELYRQGKPWKHGTPESKNEFNKLAEQVGALLESATQ